MNIADKFAPYPTSEDDVTADRLARHMAVAGFTASAQVFPTVYARDAAEGPGRANKDTAEAKAAQEIHHLTLLNTINEYAIVHLLRALIEHAPDKADEVAKDLWGAWDDGGAVGEELGEWLTGYGIDPAAITTAVAVEGKADGQ